MINFHKQSMQDLIGLDHFTTCGLISGGRHKCFWQVAPVNIAVMSDWLVSQQIQRLMQALTYSGEAEIMVLDATEDFAANKIYLQQRIDAESDPAVRNMLEQDLDRVETLAGAMAVSRLFLIAVTLPGSEAAALQKVNRIGKMLSDLGFEATLLRAAEIKKFLAMYFTGCKYGDLIPDRDGGALE